ncbi:MAG: prepilin peptidase [Candidatus Yanofskybacteria bacterium]|nr:prepilin peptidase [Candidatus Yanofskybacteria bacterium]
MLLLIYIFFLGLIVGSFVNVVIFRVPRGESVVSGRSRCTHCGNKIYWFDLIPVVSFFVLKFRCKQCHQRISWIYPAVELYSGIIFLLVFSFAGQVGMVNRLFLVFILEILLALALIDLKNLILPDAIMLVMLSGILACGILEYSSGRYLFNIFSFNNLIGAAVLFLTFFIFWFFSKGAWLGLGDAKLAGLVGLVFGLWGGLVIIYGAIIAGTVAGLVLLASHRANLKTKLPLGTFISFSATVYIFLGQGILEKVKPLFFSVPFIFK